ncbi:MAG: trypsin-like peptidase domain-containing protein, partial [Acidimicrobiales bacterium]
MEPILSTRSSDTQPLRRVRAGVFAAGLGLSLVLVPYISIPGAHAQDAGPAASVTLPSLSPIVKKVMPAVVNISVIERAGASDQQADNTDEDTGPGQPGPFQGVPPGSPFDQLLKKFFQDQGVNPSQPAPHVQRMALGSGFIIDPSGYVVTNNHVVGDAEKVTVVFQDDSKHPAKII